MPGHARRSSGMASSAKPEAHPARRRGRMNYLVEPVRTDRRARLSRTLAAPRHACVPGIGEDQSVVEAFEVPGAVHAVEVDECQEPGADHLVVVAQQRTAPPRFLDAPVVADLDRLADAWPAKDDRLAERIELDVDRRMLAEQSRHA